MAGKVPLGFNYSWAVFDPKVFLKETFRFTVVTHVSFPEVSPNAQLGLFQIHVFFFKGPRGFFTEFPVGCIDGWVNLRWFFPRDPLGFF